MPTLTQTAAPTGRQPSEDFFTTWDGMRLFFRAWPARIPANKAIVLVHRGHEHSGRFQDLVDRLALDDIAVFAWDSRGLGRSPGVRSDAESFSCLVRDLDAFVRFVSREHSVSIENIAVVAHSVGAVVAATWVHDYAPPIRALVLAAPALRVRLYVPFALSFLRVQHLLRPGSFVQSYVKAAMLTHDPEERKSYQEDKLITRAISVRILIGMYDAATRLLRDASAIRTPTLVLSSGADWVVRTPAQREFFNRLSSPVKVMRDYPGFYHDLLHEKDRHLPIGEIHDFLTARFTQPPAPPSLLEGQANRADYERLSSPAPLPERLFWKAQRLFLQTAGRLSQGIRMGWTSGFDSGESLDYVYRNQPQGSTALGRLIDRIYLESPGWRGIRRRRTNIETLLTQAIRQTHAEGRPVRILDVAAGLGRYVLETIAAMPRGIPIEAHLRDWDPRNLEQARDLAQSLDLPQVTFAQADAFDRDALAAVEPRPTIVLVSGLYELFPDNAKVQRSLEGIAAALPEGGLLLYTNQPWHPQLDMIARVLDNREGKPWIMRCRPQAEMDQLVRSAGFERLELLTDDDGIFTVSLARRLRS